MLTLARYSFYSVMPKAGELSNVHENILVYSPPTKHPTLLQPPQPCRHW